MTKRFLILLILLLCNIPVFGQSIDAPWIRRNSGPANCNDADAIAVDGSGNVCVTAESWGSGTGHGLYATGFRGIHAYTDRKERAQETLLEDFENINDWNAGGDPGYSQEADTDHKKEGNQSLKLNAPCGGEVFSTKTINQNFGSATNFILWVYVSDAEKLEYLSLFLTSDPAWNKFFYINIDGGAWDGSGYLVSGWNKLVIDKDAFTNDDNDSWESTMIRIKVRCDATVGNTVSVSFDDLRYNYQAKAKCIINFDDGCASVLNIAKPIMDGNGQKGVSFVVIDWLGLKGYMTEANLETLRDAGWDISNHSESHPHLENCSAEELDQEVNGAYQWLVNNGFPQSAKFFAYPFGAFNDAVVAEVKENHKLARCVINGEYQPLVPVEGDSEFLLKVKAIYGSTPVNNIKASIDHTIKHSQLLILLFHDIVESNPGIWGYDDDDFKEVSDYLRSKQDADFIDVITFSEYYQDMTDVKDEDENRKKPSEFTLFQNYPNLFNQSTKIEFTLSNSGFVSLNIYNILGRKVRTLVSEHLSSGYKSVLWDGKDDFGKDVASGVYFYRLKVGDSYQTKKLVLLK